MKTASNVFLKLSGDGLEAEDGRRPLLRRSLLVATAMLVALFAVLSGPVMAQGTDADAVLTKPPAVASDDDDDGGGSDGDDDSGNGTDGTGGDSNDAQTRGHTGAASDRETGRETAAQKTDRPGLKTGASTRGETDPGDKTGKTERR